MTVTRLLISGLAMLAFGGGSHAAVASAPGGTGSTGGAGMGGSAPGPTTGTQPTGTQPTGTQPPGTQPNGAHPTVPGDRARIIHGLAYAPADAPTAVQRAIWAGNAIRHKPYVYGGGHGSFHAPGYDCSGSVSYVLHGAGLVSTPLDSSDLETWGRAGAGQWITVYTNPGHAFVQIAGIRLDTSAEQDPGAGTGSGPRWRPLMDGTGGYEQRHPAGL